MLLLELRDVTGQSEVLNVLKIPCFSTENEVPAEYRMSVLILPCALEALYKIPQETGSELRRNVLPFFCAFSS